jgi:hypothetical protein
MISEYLASVSGTPQIQSSTSPNFCSPLITQPNMRVPPVGMKLAYNPLSGTLVNETGTNETDLSDNVCPLDASTQAEHAASTGSTNLTPPFQKTISCQDCGFLGAPFWSKCTRCGETMNAEDTFESGGSTDVAIPPALDEGDKISHGHRKKDSKLDEDHTSEAAAGTSWATNRYSVQTFYTARQDDDDSTSTDSSETVRPFPRTDVTRERPQSSATTFENLRQAHQRRLDEERRRRALSDPEPAPEAVLKEFGIAAHDFQSNLAPQSNTTRPKRSESRPRVSSHGTVVPHLAQIGFSQPPNLTPHPRSPEAGSSSQQNPDLRPKSPLSQCMSASDICDNPPRRLCARHAEEARVASTSTTALNASGIISQPPRRNEAMAMAPAVAAATTTDAAHAANRRRQREIEQMNP